MKNVWKKLIMSLMIGASLILLTACGGQTDKKRDEIASLNWNNTQLVKIREQDGDVEEQCWEDMVEEQKRQITYDMICSTGKYQIMSGQDASGRTGVCVSTDGGQTCTTYPGAELVPDDFGSGMEIGTMSVEGETVNIVWCVKGQPRLKVYYTLNMEIVSVARV